VNIKYESKNICCSCACGLWRNWDSGIMRSETHYHVIDVLQNKELNYWKRE